MLITIVIIGSVLVVLGLILTENNARYLLSGDNTLAAEEREKVDIRSFIQYFRRFHQVFGLLFIALALSPGLKGSLRMHLSMTCWWVC